jgi:hypothetical protein
VRRSQTGLQTVHKIWPSTHKRMPIKTRLQVPWIFEAAKRSTSERKLVSCERARDPDGGVSRIVPSLPSNTKLDRRIPSLSHSHLGSTNTVLEQYALPVKGLNPLHSTVQCGGNLMPLAGIPNLPQNQIHNGQNSIAINQPRSPFTWPIPMIKIAPKVPRERSFSLSSSASNSSLHRSPYTLSDHSTTTANSCFLNSHRHASCTMCIETQIEDSDEKLRMHAGDTCSPGPEYMVSDWIEERPSEDSLCEREKRMQEIVYRVRNSSFDSSQAGTALHKAPITCHPQKIIDLGAGSGWWANKSL